MLLTLRSGCKKDGTLTFRQVHTLHDNGAYTSWGATTPFVMMQTFSSLYRVPHCDYHTVAVYTNNPYAGSFRGYGNLQATFAVEQHMDMLAEAIGMDPLEFRLKNAQEPGEVTRPGHELQELRLQGLPDHRRRAQRLRAQAPRERAPTAATPGRIKRGIGIASMLHVGGGAKIYPSDGCGTILKMDDFAHVTLITGASEIGQGSETVLAQLVCEELGLPISAVTVVNNDTDDHALGRRRARQPHHLHRRQLGDRRGEEGQGEDPRRGGEEVRLRRERARPARRPRRSAPTAARRWSTWRKLLRSLHFQDKAELVMTTFYYEPPSEHQDKGFKGDVSAAYAWAHAGGRGRGRHRHRHRQADSRSPARTTSAACSTGSASRARSRAASSWARAMR